MFEGSASGNVYAVDATGTSATPVNAGSPIAAPDEQTSSQPLTGLAAGEGTLIVPAGDTLVAYEGANIGSGTPTNTLAPAVTGAALTGQALGADVGVWTGLPTTPTGSGYTYQWQRCNSSGLSCQSIVGAIGESYTPTSGDIGSTLVVQVTATNGSGTAPAVTSAPTAVVALAPPANLTLPTVSGSAVQGSTLTATHGTWTNTSGPTSYTYQWESCLGDFCNDISGATQSTYTPVNTDVGSDLYVIVSASNAGGTSHVPAWSSNFVGPITAPASQSGGATVGPFSYLQAPSITGTPKVGTLLTASPGEWNTAATFTYQWQACEGSGFNCANITGATTTQYTPITNDIGLTLRVIVVGSASGHAPITTASQVTAAVTGPPPAPTPPLSPTAALAALGVRLGATPRIATLIHHGMSAIVYCPTACTVSLSLNATAADRGLKGAVGVASARLRAGQTRALSVAVARRWDKPLAKLSKATFKLVVVVHGSAVQRYVDPITIKR